MSIGVTYTYVKGAFEKAFAELNTGMAEAGYNAIKRAGDDLKTKVRANIASAGFSRGWQNAWRVNIYPKQKGPRLDAAAFGFHKIPYAGIFETGGVIGARGGGLLWLPLSSNPVKKSGSRGKRITPADFVARIGPLFTMKSKTGTPLLGTPVAVNKNGRLGKVTRAKIGKTNTGRTVLVPMFFGVPTVNIRKRFNIAQVANEIRAELPELFAEEMEKVNG